MKKYVIIAPHADDEIIGCYSYLMTGKVKEVVFGTMDAVMEAHISAETFGFSAKCITDYDFKRTAPDMDNHIVYLFPDPTYEIHPKHRELGFLGESLLREGQEVIFYTTNMSAPYIFEVTEPASKLDSLNLCYTSKEKLWLYEHKYFLFEGYTQWLINPMLCQD